MLALLWGSPSSLGQGWKVYRERILKRAWEHQVFWLLLGLVSRIECACCPRNTFVAFCFLMGVYRRGIEILGKIYSGNDVYEVYEY